MFFSVMFSIDMLKRSFPSNLTEGLIDLHRVADKLEWRMYSLARNQVHI
jgi:hypothetical protein